LQRRHALDLREAHAVDPALEARAVRALVREREAHRGVAAQDRQRRGEREARARDLRERGQGVGPTIEAHVDAVGVQLAEVEQAPHQPGVFVVGRQEFDACAAHAVVGEVLPNHVADDVQLATADAHAARHDRTGRKRQRGHHRHAGLAQVERLREQRHEARLAIAPVARDAHGRAVRDPRLSAWPVIVLRERRHPAPAIRTK
jgi:hypothetical protein